MTTAPSTTQLDFVSFSDLVNWSVRYLRENRSRYKTTFALVRIGDFLKRNRHIIEIQDDELYTRVTIRLYTKGVLKRDEEWGHNIGTKRQFIVSPGQFIMSKIDARNGAFGLVPPELDGAATTADFLSYNVDTSRINPAFLTLVSSTKEFLTICQSSSSGTTGRQRVDETQFLNIKIPLPSLTEQDRIVAAYNARIAEADRLAEQAEVDRKNGRGGFLRELGILEELSSKIKNNSLQFLRFSDLEEWGVDSPKARLQRLFKSSKFKTLKISDLCKIGSGGTPSRGKRAYYEGQVPWIKTGEIREQVIYDTEEKISDTALEESSARVYPINSLIVAMYGATAGRSAKLGIAASTNQACAILYDINTSLVNIDFLWTYLKTQIESLKSLATGSAQPNLNSIKISNFLIPIPSLEIQEKLIGEYTAHFEEAATLNKLAQNQRQQAIEDIENELFAS